MSQNYKEDQVVPPIKKYTMDTTLSWEDRYKKLEEHHLKETKWFEQEVLRLRGLLKQRKCT